MIFLIFIILTIFLVSFSASLLETAIFSTSIHKIAILQKVNPNKYKKILNVKKNSSEVIASIVILNNLSNVIGSISIGILIEEILSPFYVIIFSFFFTLTIIIFCEIIPKILGERYASQIIFYFISIITFLPIIFKPILFIMRQPFKSFYKKDSIVSISEKEIEALTKLGNQEGSITREKASIIQKASTMNNILAKNIMTPRIKIKAFEANKKISEIKNKLINSHFTRIPLYEKNLDQIIGIIYKMDILKAIISKNENLKVNFFLKKCLFIPENKPIDKLLEELRKNAHQIAIVVNEHGGISGIITLEDILEELVGDIRSEREEREDVSLHYHILSEEEMIVSGSFNLEKIGHFFNIEFENPYTKVSKFILDHLNRFPKVGEKIKINQLIFTIGQTTKKTIEKIRIKKEKSKKEDTN